MDLRFYLKDSFASSLAMASEAYFLLSFQRHCLIACRCRQLIIMGFSIHMQSSPCHESPPRFSKFRPLTPFIFEGCFSGRRRHFSLARFFSGRHLLCFGFRHVSRHATASAPASSPRVKYPIKDDGCYDLLSSPMSLFLFSVMTIIRMMPRISAADVCRISATPKHSSRLSIFLKILVFLPHARHISSLASGYLTRAHGGLSRRFPLL